MWSLVIGQLFIIFYIFMDVYLFFEQSGTFKSEFLKLGFSAFDCDIVQTSHVDFCRDLLLDIENCYDHLPSIFDSILPEDLVFAFYPCIRFTDSIHINFTGTSKSFKFWSVSKKLEYDLKLHDELHRLYSCLCKLCLICLDRGFKLIIENPYSKYHYLKYYFPIEPVIVDMNRSLSGDYFVKPTQFWFINFSPKFNFVLDPLVYHDRKLVRKVSGFERSRFSSDYASRFIKQYII